MMQLEFATTMTVCTAITITPQFGLPFNIRKYCTPCKLSTAMGRIFLFVDSSLKRVLPVACNFPTLLGMLLSPSSCTFDDLFTISPVPTMLVSLRYFAMVAVVVALISTMSFAILLPPFAASSLSASLIFTVVLSSLTTMFGWILSVQFSSRHAGRVYHHHHNNFEARRSTAWTRNMTIYLKGSSLATCSTELCQRTRCKTPTNSRYLVTRINPRSLPAAMRDSKFSLIDLDGEIPNKAEGASHRERLSERTSHVDDATVCSHGNWNHERLAEMTSPALLSE